MNPVVLGKVDGSIWVGFGPDIRLAAVEVEDHRELKRELEVGLGRRVVDDDGKTCRAGVLLDPPAPARLTSDFILDVLDPV